MAVDPLAAKRKQLYDLIAAKRKARQAAVTSYPELDLNEVATAFNGPEGNQLRRDIENMRDEATRRSTPARTRHGSTGSLSCRPRRLRRLPLRRSPGRCSGTLRPR